MAWQSCPATKTLTSFDLDFQMRISPHLSMILDFSLDLVLSHVNNVTRSCFCYLRQLLLSRQSPPLHAITILVHTLICTRVDYGNAVYIGLSSTNASKFQSVLTAAAHLIGASQSSSISLLSPETPFTGFLFTSTSNSRSTTS